MASISSAPPSSIASNLRRTRRPHAPLLLPSSLRLAPHRPFRRLSISARFHSSKASSGPNGSHEDHSSSGEEEELHHALPPPQTSGKAAPVFVTLPIDAVTLAGQMTRRKAMGASLMALANAGVEGITVEFWWGIVERDGPGVYDWSAYLDLVTLAESRRLKVRAIMAFHQCGTGPGPGHPCWIPFPQWVCEEMDKEPDLAYSDKYGRRNKEYISLGCDMLPFLRGRTPIQAYSDFMRSFRDTFRDFLGVIITEIQVGMGPAGELRYPSCPTEKLIRPGNEPELGEFQSYDKFMQASLNASARKLGVHQWGHGGPLGTTDVMHNPERTSFFKSDGSWNSAYGQFFLEWYSGMLLRHGERLCLTANAVFWGTGVKISAKVAAIHWHYGTCSHPSELTAGYYNTLTRDGYLPIAQLFSRYSMALCCTCFDVRDTEIQSESKSSPEGCLRQLVHAARMYNLSLCGENSVTRLDDESLKQVIKSCRLYSTGSNKSSLSFNFVRMNRDLFDPYNWNRFTRFVKQMSDARTFQAAAMLGLSYRPNGRYLSSLAADEVGRVITCL
ncbi:Beta-amylase protein [Dioscorea alata]|uniref:Beta-amylase protein n=1 Tax=Dioscorea alata TaxID=55571 RepID=A0ACB7UCQ1_DIOAL|nr:Beta-amylase protein [Dioscorea alata]